MHQSDTQGTLLLHTQYDLPFDSRSLQTALRFHASEILGNTRSNSLKLDGVSYLLTFYINMGRSLQSDLGIEGAMLA